MQVVEIDVITPQPLERALERPAYRRRSGSAVTGLPGELRGEHDAVAASLEDLAEVALARSPVPVDLRRVEERDAGVERGLDDGARPGEVEAPSEVVAPEADDGDLAARSRRDFVRSIASTLAIAESGLGS